VRAAAVVLLALACAGLACGSDAPRPAPGPPSPSGKKQLVRLTLDGEVPERSTPGFLGAAESRSIYEWTTLLDDLGRDADVAAVFLEIRTIGCGWACAEELARAFETLRGTGRKVHCMAEELDDREYLFATRACDRIAMEPGGTLWLDGLAVRGVFLREALASLGLQADIVHVGRYKDAGEPLTHDAMSPEMRTQLEEVLDGRFGTVLSGVAAARKKAPEAVREIVDRGPFTAPEALARGLVDVVVHSDRFRSQVRRETGGRFIDDHDRDLRERASADDLGEVLRTLSGDRARPRLDEPSLVVVYVTGPIARAGSEAAGLLGESGATADELVPLLEDLAKDENVKAVVLRVDSPGGSALASDLIWRAARRLDRKVPVVASMGDVAASGGYYVSVAARRIFADASTITGSIGVVGGKIATRELLGLIHVHEETLTRGANSAMLTSSGRFTGPERERLQSMMEQTYGDFVGRVATGRKMTHAAVRAIAEGRIYTGTHAMQIGLVDEIGGLGEAIAWARRAARLPETATVVRLPSVGGLLDALTGVATGRAAVSPSIDAIVSRLASPELRAAASRALLLEADPVLAVLPVAF